MNQLQLIFVYGMQLGSKFIVFYMHIQLFQQPLLKIILSAVNCLSTLVKNQLAVYMWACFSSFGSVLLISLDSNVHVLITIAL